MPKLTPAVNSRDHVQGDEKAKIELVEYGDFQCPHCKRAHPVLKNIQRQLGKRLRFVFRHFPLTNAHPYAMSAAVAAEAASIEGKFWEMHDLIFERQDELSDGIFTDWAQELALNSREFSKHLRDAELKERVQSDFESGIRSGVNGTPSLFINGRKYEGMVDEEELLNALLEMA